MATQSDISAVFPLNHIDELFNAPSSDPFSSHEVDILGKSAMDCIANRVTRIWPRRPNAVHMTLQLPADQITPDLKEDTRIAVQRYCTDRIESNQLQRGIVIQNSRQQFWGAMICLTDSFGGDRIAGNKSIRSASRLFAHNTGRVGILCGRRTCLWFLGVDDLRLGSVRTRYHRVPGTAGDGFDSRGTTGRKTRLIRWLGSNSRISR